MGGPAKAIDGSHAGGTDAPRDEGPTTERRCIATGRVLPQAQLLRFAVGPEGDIVPDVDGKLGGRGIWLSADRDSIITAAGRKLFQRAARRAVKVDDRLADRVEALLARRCVELLSLARRAGQSVAGFEKVRSWLQAGKVALLVAATDGATGSREKIAHQSAGVPVSTALRADEIGRAFGRERVVFAAVSRGGLAERLAESLGRLHGMRRTAE